MPGISPSTPQQKEQKGFTQDGMSPKGSNEQAGHAGGQSSNSNDKAKGEVEPK